MTDAAPLACEQRGAVLIARLDRPQARNALTPDLIRAIGSAVVDAEDDPDVRAVVLTGTGDRAFCAGMDLRAFATDGGFGFGDDEVAQAFYRLLEGRVAVPLVGAANAAAVAGGFELLLGCDVMVAAEHATFGLPEVQRGLLPGGGGTLLGTRIPLSVALEMTLTGDPITAARAYELGLVNAVVSSGEVLARAVEIADRIARNGPLAVRAVKELVRLGATDVADARERLSELQPIVFGSQDAREGAQAFIEKRPPTWRGR
jgi:enoyl-CoA hydratase/carnithine racemase